MCVQVEVVTLMCTVHELCIFLLINTCSSLITATGIEVSRNFKMTRHQIYAHSPRICYTVLLKQTLFQKLLHIPVCI